MIIAEHDLLLIRAADYVIDLGPRAGALRGKIVAEGKPELIIKADTVTGKWLKDDRLRPASRGRSLHGWILLGQRRKPQGWIEIKGARANNLKGENVQLPLNTLTSVCCVSGSGKSTLLIDTLGRALVKKVHASSFAREPIEPGRHDSIENASKRAFVVDQSEKRIRSPAAFLGLMKPLLKVYADSDDADRSNRHAQKLT